MYFIFCKLTKPQKNPIALYRRLGRSLSAYRLYSKSSTREEFNRAKNMSSDISGHCHGGSVPDTFYWWVRDHWHRAYSGRLKCCCDWPPEGLVNRCDYRVNVPEGMNTQCRDANEEHEGPGKVSFIYGYESEGCPQTEDQINYQEPDEGQCWEVLNFGVPGTNLFERFLVLTFSTSLFASCLKHFLQAA